LRVVHYHPFMLTGESGTATAARGWADAIERLGVPVLALVDGEAMHLSPSERVQCIPLHHKLHGRARVPIGLTDYLEETDILVLHGGWLLRNVVVASSAARKGIAFVVTAHGVYNPHVFSRRPFSKWLWATALERRQLQRALALHLFFKEEENGLERVGVHTPTIISPNGIVTPTDTTWDGGSGGYLLWLGRFSPHNKGLDLLIRAVHELPPGSRPELRLHGPDWRGQKHVVEQLVKRLDLDRWVTIGEPIYGDAKWDLISRAAGCVYPSRWEGCSVAVLEALSLGIPTLVTPYAMGQFLAKEGAAIEVGWTVREIADGLLRLKSPEAKRIGETASEVARTRFSWKTVAESWLSQVQELTTRTSPSPK
jgi:glycosyltransferase involved in cell wall biosynthesis